MLVCQLCQKNPSEHGCALPAFSSLRGRGHGSSHPSWPQQLGEVHRVVQIFQMLKAAHAPAISLYPQCCCSSCRHVAPGPSSRLSLTGCPAIKPPARLIPRDRLLGDKWTPRGRHPSEHEGLCPLQACTAPLHGCARGISVVALSPSSRRLGQTHRSPQLPQSLG